MFLVLLTAVNLPFVNFHWTNGCVGSITYHPGLKFWWNSTSPAGEQTGFAITKGDFEWLFGFEESNGGYVVYWNYCPSTPDDPNRYWLKDPPPYTGPLPVPDGDEGPPQMDLAPEAPEAPEPPIRVPGESNQAFLWRTFDFNTGHQREWIDGKELLGNIK